MLITFWRCLQSASLFHLRVQSGEDEKNNGWTHINKNWSCTLLDLLRSHTPLLKTWWTETNWSKYLDQVSHWGWLMDLFNLILWSHVYMHVLHHASAAFKWYFAIKWLESWNVTAKSVIKLVKGINQLMLYQLSTLELWCLFVGIITVTDWTFLCIDCFPLI